MKVSGLFDGFQRRYRDLGDFRDGIPEAFQRASEALQRV